MITACCLQHIRNQLGGDWGSRFVLLVLSRVGKVGDYGCDSAGRGGFAGVDHDEEFHESVVDIAGSGRLEYEYCEGDNQPSADRWKGIGEEMFERDNVPSSSRTLSPTVTLVSWFE